MTTQDEIIYRSFPWLETIEHCEGYNLNYDVPSPTAMIYVDKVHLFWQIALLHKQWLIGCWNMAFVVTPTKQTILAELSNTLKEKCVDVLHIDLTNRVYIIFNGISFKPLNIDNMVVHIDVGG